jgi:hypothetical protein
MEHVASRCSKKPTQKPIKAIGGMLILRKLKTFKLLEEIIAYYELVYHYTRRQMTT